MSGKDMARRDPSSRHETSARWSHLESAVRKAGLRAQTQCPLGSRTTYRVGGTAALGVWVSSPDDAETLGRLVGDEMASDGPIQVLPVGNGSNLLVADDGFDGVAVFLGDALAAGTASVPSRPESTEVDSVQVAAATMLPVLARVCVTGGWCGAEWMVGVPGTVGGAVRMNAGGHGSDMAAMLETAEIVNLASGVRATVRGDDLGLRFRGSALADHHLVVGATLALRAPQDHEGRTCHEELSAIVAWRREHQPGGHNAGSVFVNPGTDSASAGAHIDAAAMRGHRVGTAAVSDKHANFIQADPGGRAADVVEVMCAVQDAVLARGGVRLRSEVRLVGFPAAVAARFGAHVDYGIDDAAIADAEARLEALL